MKDIAQRIEDCMVTPISKEDCAYNDGIRTAIMIVESAGARDLIDVSVIEGLFHLDATTEYAEGWNNAIDWIVRNAPRYEESKSKEEAKTDH